MSQSSFYKVRQGGSSLTTARCSFSAKIRLSVLHEYNNLLSSINRPDLHVPALPFYCVYPLTSSSAISFYSLRASILSFLLGFLYTLCSVSYFIVCSLLLPLATCDDPTAIYSLQLFLIKSLYLLIFLFNYLFLYIFR